MTHSNIKYDGQCAFALSTGKTGVKGNEKHAIETNAETYLFSNPVAKVLWKILPGRKIKADQIWSSK